MDREERLQALNEIEGQLSQYLAADKKNWIQTYLSVLGRVPRP